MPRPMGQTARPAVWFEFLEQSSDVGLPHFWQAHLEDSLWFAFLSTWAGGETQGLIGLIERTWVVPQLREDDDQALLDPALGHSSVYRMEFWFPRERLFDGFKQSLFHVRGI